MRKLLRVILVASLVVMAISIVLLLNFTAPNPTGRRYSSEQVVTTGGRGNNKEIGLSAERILSKDLGLPRNEDPSQLQCGCNQAKLTSQPPLAECRVCIVDAPMQSKFRRPDFIGDGFIAESKNWRNFIYDEKTIDQIGDYAIMALAMKQPLWVFVRHKTFIAQEYVDLVAKTGGGIVPYFAYEGYVDPIDDGAKIALVVSSLSGGMSLLGLMMPKRAPRRPKPASAKWQPSDIPDVLERAKQKAQATIDKEDSRHKL
jgi:hypothetical protein